MAIIYYIIKIYNHLSYILVLKHEINQLVMK